MKHQLRTGAKNNLTCLFPVQSCLRKEKKKSIQKKPVFIGEACSEYKRKERQKMGFKT